MRSSIVPAQITTVEDKLTGNISVYQAMLLCTPVLFGFIITLILPPFGQFNIYKIFMTLGFLIICSPLAIRIDDKIIVHWLRLFIIYSIRPRYYVYDKNSQYLRDTEISISKSERSSAPTFHKQQSTAITISPKEFARLQTIATDTHSEVSFEFEKEGILNVHITKAE